MEIAIDIATVVAAVLYVWIVYHLVREVGDRGEK